MEEDPEQVVNLFMSGANAEESVGKGLIYRMNDLIGDYLNGSASNTLDGLERSIREIDSQKPPPRTNNTSSPPPRRLPPTGYLDSKLNRPNSHAVRCP